MKTARLLVVIFIILISNKAHSQYWFFDRLNYKHNKRIRFSVPLTSAINKDLSNSVKKDLVKTISPTGYGINYMKTWGIGFTTLAGNLFFDSSYKHERKGQTDFLDVSYLFGKRSFINYTIGLGHLLSGNQIIINGSSKNVSKKALGYSIFHQIGLSGNKWEIVFSFRDIKTQYTHDFSSTGGRTNSKYNLNLTYSLIGVGYRY